MKLGIGGKMCIGGKLGTSIVKYTVTYHVDTGTTYTEKVLYNKSALSPTTFVPEKDGYTFIGWRTDGTANSTILTEQIVTGNIVLYAVYQKTIVVTYYGNGNTSGSTESQTVYQYYNNGNSSPAPSITLRSNGFARSGWTFSKWAKNSASGTQYASGTSVTLSENTTFYAVWTRNSTTITSLGLSQYGDYSYYTNTEKKPKSVSISGNTIHADMGIVSYCGFYATGWGNTKYDLVGYNKATVYFSDSCESGYVGFGTTRGIFAVKSATLNNASSITVDISSLDSGYFGAYHSDSVNPNYETNRSFSLVISKIVLSA